MFLCTGVYIQCRRVCIRFNQLINVNIWTPKKLSPEEKEMLEKMRGLPNFIPKEGKGQKGFFARMKDYFE